MKHYDVLVVGSGLSGATIAYLLKKRGQSVLVLEKKPWAGGAIRTEVEDDIVVHCYGPHIFHTSDKEVWDFVNGLVPFYPFINSPIANFRGELYPLPFNMNTFAALWGVKTPEEAEAKIKEETAKEHIGVPTNLEEQALSLVGRTIYEKLIKGYTEKQWGRPCKDLPASILKRVPLRFRYDNNYFNDIYQGIPKGGYSVLIAALLQGIEVRYNCDFLSDKARYIALADQVYYTGLIDGFFAYRLGLLSYRSLRFEKEVLPIDSFQTAAVTNYTDATVPYTRITEHKKFDPSCPNHTSTILYKEYPLEYHQGLDPFYPVGDQENRALYERYRALALKEAPSVRFAGRLGTYSYYDMDKAIRAVFDLLKSA